LSLYLLMLAHSQMIVNYTFSIQYKSHNKSKDIPHSGACEKDLPAQRHGEVLDGLLQPQGDDLVAGVHEEAGGDKTHHRAHQAYDHGRDR